MGVCDLLCALPGVTGASTLFAKNSDRPPGEIQVFERFPPRRDRPGTATTWVEVPPHPAVTLAVVGSRPSWGWGLEHGVNEAGVAAGNASIYTTADPRRAPDGLTGMDLVRLALERAVTATAAVEIIGDLIATVGQGGSGHEGGRRPYWSSFLLADPQRAYVLETSGAEMAVESVVDVRAISNRTTIAAFDAVHRHPRQPVEVRVDPRLAASVHALAARPVDVAGLQAHLSSHQGGPDGWTICMHVDDPDHGEVTAASMVAELHGDAPSVVHYLVGHPCTGRYETMEI
ncbi:MAG: hypothetical protein EXQ71_03610 [Acidimicrobiia bacterium]|nr:hypothetical protein [Acidimicrobiia bacterium]